MRNFKKMGLMLIAAVVFIFIFIFSDILFADTTITTTTHDPYFHSGAGPISSVFYFIGDVVVLPFRLVGDLFT